MPGDSRRKIEKAGQLPVDCIVMDLEDGVALNRKEEARRIIREVLETQDFGERERLIRLNEVDSDLFAPDLEITAAGRPDGYVLPKIETAAQINSADSALTALEKRYGYPLNALKILAVVETALGIMNLKEIATASDRLEALLFGAEDLAVDMGAERTRDGQEVFYARSAVVTAAAAYRLQAIDMVFTDLQDLSALAEECSTARRMGFAGKMAVHPRQVPVIQEAFTPTREAVERAVKLIEAYHDHQARGIGAFTFEGRMVDRPMVRSAEHIIIQAGPAKRPE